MRPSLQDAAYSRRGVADDAEMREDLLEAGHAEDPAWPAQALRRNMPEENFRGPPLGLKGNSVVRSMLDL